MGRGATGPSELDTRTHAGVNRQVKKASFRPRPGRSTSARRAGVDKAEARMSA